MSASIVMKRNPFTENDVRVFTERAARVESATVRFAWNRQNDDSPVTAAIVRAPEELQSWYRAYPFDVRPGRDRLAGLLDHAGELPDVVVLAFGANDVMAGPLRREPGYGPAAANIGEMASRVRANGARVLVALPVGAPPPRPGDPDEARTILRKMRRGFARLRKLLHAAYPGRTIDLRLSRHELFADVLHPTPARTDVLARRVARRDSGPEVSPTTARGIAQRLRPASLAFALRRQAGGSAATLAATVVPVVTSTIDHAHTTVSDSPYRVASRTCRPRSSYRCPASALNVGRGLSIVPVLQPWSTARVSV